MNDKRRFYEVRPSFLLSVLGFLIPFILFEIFLLIMMYHPQSLKGWPFLLDDLRYLYMRYDRLVIQYDENCFQYDPELSYLLKPGKCFFKTREYQNEFRINHAGLRDDEDSLVRPEIIILGDSHAMGWGVNREEMFPRLVEEITGMKVLNAGISSFGTVREMMLLNRLDTSNMKYLIIQYNTWDVQENDSFLLNGNRLDVMSSEQYQAIRSALQQTVDYYPGKWTVRILERFFNEIVQGEPLDFIQYKSQDEIQSFLNALMFATRKSLNNVQLIILEFNEYCSNDGEFVAFLKQAILKNDYPEFIENLKVIHTEDILNSDQHCYVLDDHMNSRGHRAAAEAISQVILYS